MRVRPIFAWYDFWVGAFWDRAKRRLYLLPIPCIGIVFDFGGATGQALLLAKVKGGWRPRINDLRVALSGIETLAKSAPIAPPGAATKTLRTIQDWARRALDRDRLPAAPAGADAIRALAEKRPSEKAKAAPGLSPGRLK